MIRDQALQQEIPLPLDRSSEADKEEDSTQPPINIKITYYNPPSKKHSQSVPSEHLETSPITTDNLVTDQQISS